MSAKDKAAVPPETFARGDTLRVGGEPYVIQRCLFRTRGFKQTLAADWRPSWCSLHRYFVAVDKTGAVRWLKMVVLTRNGKKMKTRRMDEEYTRLRACAGFVIADALGSVRSVDVFGLGEVPTSVGQAQVLVLEYLEDHRTLRAARKELKGEMRDAFAELVARWLEESPLPGWDMHACNVMVSGEPGALDIVLIDLLPIGTTLSNKAERTIWKITR